MNIHLKNKEDFESLMGSVYLTVKVGSNLYGCQNQESDTDYLHFYAEHEDDTKSFLWTHHQLQYKTDKEDHNFTTLKSFIRNLLTGDSTINYEVLHSKDLQNNKDLNFLLDYIKEFASYNLLRSYVGFAKRDLKMFKNRQGRNKLFHIKRALWSIDRILEENYSNEFKNDKAYYSELMDLKNSIEDLRSVAPNFEKEIESKRQNINDLFESGKIRKGMYSDKLIELDKALIRFQNSDIYLQKRLKTRIIFDQQYSSLFEDVIY